MARHGENIHKRRDGRWEARIIIDRDQNNKAIYRSIYGNTYDEVKEKKAEFVLSGKRFIQGDITFDEAAQEWLASKKGKVKVSTYNHYFNQFQLHIKSYFEGKRLTDLKCEDYDCFLLKMEEESYSSRTITLLRTIIKMIMKFAEIKYGIPARKEVYIPHKPARQSAAFTRTEQTALEDHCVNHTDGFTLAILISLYCGLRIGEVCALQWQNVNLTTGIITVSKTMIRIQNKDCFDSAKTRVILQKPKTESSIRKIPIPNHLQSVLKSNFSNYTPVTFVITGTLSYMEPRVCLRKFKNIVTNLNLGDYTFHSCRHTYATRFVKLGIDPNILSELLGHSSVKTTLDCYVHPSMDFKKEQVNKLVFLNDHK